MVSSARSVGLTMVLITAALYMFAVVFTQLLPGTQVGKDYYDTVGLSLFTLLVEGILPDQVHSEMQEQIGGNINNNSIWLNAQLNNWKEINL